MRFSEAKRKAAAVVGVLRSTYPEAACALHFSDPFELLVATILSAQCTDVRVNMVTPALFRRYPDPAALSGADPAELGDLIRSTGFFRNKSKNLLGCAAALVERHGGAVPATMAELVALPGVGRKTANVVLGNAFATPGMVVDTHVKRVAGRLGWTASSDPVKIEADLQRLLPKEEWTEVSHLLIHHGRALCKAPTPWCSSCPLLELCPRRGVNRSR
ncbi:MAG TPA: endonuclease III [Desulfuromonadales bacterium]|nr:endonuclease III [Desulfuromonadales bacterium]